MTPVEKYREEGHDWERKRAPQIEQHSLLHMSSLPLAPGPTQQTTHLIFPPPPQNTKHYELLNYSEHGTTVDNVLYSCDFSEKTPPTPPSSIVAKVQSVISKLEQACGHEACHFWTHFLRLCQGGSGLLPVLCCLLPSWLHWPSAYSWAQGESRRTKCRAPTYVYSTSDLTSPF